MHFQCAGQLSFHGWHPRLGWRSVGHLGGSNPAKGRLSTAKTTRLHRIGNEAYSEDFFRLSFAFRQPEPELVDVGPRRTPARGRSSASRASFSTGLGDGTRGGIGVGLGGGGRGDIGVVSVGVVIGGGVGAVPPTLGPPDSFGGGPRGLLPFGSSIAGPLSFLF